MQILHILFLNPSPHLVSCHKCLRMSKFPSTHTELTARESLHRGVFLWSFLGLVHDLKPSQFSSPFSNSYIYHPSDTVKLLSSGGHWQLSRGFLWAPNSDAAALVKFWYSLCHYIWRSSSEKSGKNQMDLSLNLMFPANSNFPCKVFSQHLKNHKKWWIC